MTRLQIRAIRMRARHIPVLLLVVLTLASLAIHAPTPVYTALNPASEPLLALSDLVYQGSFRLPPDANYYGWAYAEGTMGYFPGHNSLFIEGHPYARFIGEVQVPDDSLLSPGNTTIASLPIARELQPLTDATEGGLTALDNADPGTRAVIGGILPYKGKLYVSTYLYYAALNEYLPSHFVSGLDLSVSGDVRGPYAVAGQGMENGYFGVIPPEWQSLLGAPVMNGNCCIPIVGRTSSGPAAFGLDPERLGIDSGVRWSPLLYYPLDKPLADPNNRVSGNALYSAAEQMGGVVFPQGTRSVLFFGRHGSGPYCYGLASDCNDPVGSPSQKSAHTYPYNYQVWAYDANDFAAVNAGLRQAWDVKPYATWTLPVQFPAPDPRMGAAFDPATGRIFVILPDADHGTGSNYDRNPLIAVYKVRTNSSPDAQPPSPPADLVAVPASTTQIQLSWVASTDNAGVSGYKIFRNGTQIGTSYSNSYTDSGLAAATDYTYYVEAYDFSGNISGPSSSVTARVVAAAPPHFGGAAPR
jgi:hypothetical protein